MAGHRGFDRNATYISRSKGGYGVKEMVETTRAVTRLFVPFQFMLIISNGLRCLSGGFCPDPADPV
jgi:hypothetical protein